MLATFDGRSRAVECARHAHIETAEIGLTIRAGLHTGEIELRADNDIASMGVHIAARIAALANAGETIVSRTVKDSIIDSGFVFDGGEHAQRRRGHLTAAPRRHSAGRRLRIRFALDLWLLRPASAGELGAERVERAGPTHGTVWVVGLVER